MKKLILFIVIIFCFACASKPKQIGILPYGNIDESVINLVSDILKTTYKTEVIILNKKELPKSAFVTIKSSRYRADSLLKDLLKIRPDSIDYVIGITAKDISTTKRNANGAIKKPESKYTDWGIFGLGYRPGKSCVISTFRLQNTDSETFYSRVQKISIHEIGHNLGLKHCDTDKCVMQDAVETINTVDSVGFELCALCFKQIN